MNKERETKRYLERVKPRLEEVKAWARDGVTEEEIAKLLNIKALTKIDINLHVVRLLSGIMLILIFLRKTIGLIIHQGQKLFDIKRIR